MDCEKFETTLLDELYDELDEVTSAAAKRHVNGCARCSSLLSGMRATKRVAVLPIVEPPADLEDRIFRAAREAQKVVPIRGRLSTFVSLAGSWAMRPQTAMAALFFVMIGTSFLLLKGKKAPSTVVTVSDQGEPVASIVAMPSVARPLEPETARAAERPAAVAAAAVAAAPTAAGGGPSGAAASEGALARGVGGAPGRAPAPKSLAYDDGEEVRALNAGPAAGAPATQAAQPYGGYASNPTATSPPPPPALRAVAQNDSLLAPAAPPAAAPQAPAAREQAATPVDAAKSAFDAQDFAGALAKFDAIYGQTGDPLAELYAARSAVKANGVTTDAIARFENVIAAAPASKTGYDAKYEEAQAYRDLGDYDDARARLVQLLTVKSHMAKAQAMLDQMSARGGAGASKTSRAAPAPKAAPPSAASGVPSY